MIGNVNTPFEHIECLFRDWNYGHPKVMYGLVRALQPKVVVEVGTYRGYAACYLAQALKDNGSGHLYCIDDFSEGIQKKYDADHWRGNINACNLAEWVTLLEGRSNKVIWPEKVDFAYIDGWHGFTTVAHDVNECATRGAECICMDDVTTTVGPALFVERGIPHLLGFQCVTLHRDCGLAILMRSHKREPLTFSQELVMSPGVDLREMDEEKFREHLMLASSINLVNYGGLKR